MRRVSTGLAPLLVGRRGQVHPMRSAADRRHLRRLAWRLSHSLPSLDACTHLKGHGGLKGAVRRTRSALRHHRYVCRTDVKSFYASIDHFTLLDQLAAYVPDRAIATMNTHLSGLGLTLHPDKTTIGPIARGFDVLGYQFDADRLSLSARTLKRHQEKLTRLYERYHRQLRANRAGWIGQSTIPHRHDPARAYLNPRPNIRSHEDIHDLLEAYQRRFNAWATGGVKECLSKG